jgi:8-oxo-dGTP pyrophosphatase MutT (NUDIX family)
VKEIRYTAAGGVVVAEDRVLILRRPSRGEVRLPKGKVEPDEDALETALREVREEGGFADLEVVVDLGALTNEFDTIDEDGSTIHMVRDEHYWLMRLTSPSRYQRPPEDEEDFLPDFLPVDEALEALTYDAEKEWVRRALAALPAPTV